MQRTTKVKISKLTHVRERKKQTGRNTSRYGQTCCHEDCFVLLSPPLGNSQPCLYKGFWPGHFYIPGNLWSFVIFTLSLIPYQIHLILQNIRNWLEISLETKHWQTHLAEKLAFNLAIKQRRGSGWTHRRRRGPAETRDSWKTVQQQRCEIYWLLFGDPQCVFGRSDEACYLVRFMLSNSSSHEQLRCP